MCLDNVTCIRTVNVLCFLNDLKPILMRLSLKHKYKYQYKCHIFACMLLDPSKICSSICWELIMLPPKDILHKMTVSVSCNLKYKKKPTGHILSHVLSSPSLSLSSCLWFVCNRTKNNHLHLSLKYIFLSFDQFSSAWYICFIISLANNPFLQHKQNYGEKISVAPHPPSYTHTRCSLSQNSNANVLCCTYGGLNQSHYVLFV